MRIATVGHLSLLRISLIFEILISSHFSKVFGAEALEATHHEVAPIRVELGPDGKLETIAMDAQGRLLLGLSWSADGKSSETASNPPRRPGPRDKSENPLLVEGGPRKYAIELLSSAGEKISTWPLEDLRPSMIHGCDNGEIYVAGSHRVTRFSADGKPIHTLHFNEILEGTFATAHASGVTANDEYFFLAFGQGFSMRATEDIIRLNRDLTEPKLLIEQQFGCCSHIDLDVKDDILYVAENSRHRVNRYSLDGKKLDTWGSRDRARIEGFAACCNPVNFDWGPNGELYTAESGIGRIKRYSPEGKYLGLVGYVDTTMFDNGSMLAAMSCYIPVEVSSDGSRIFVMDVRANFIRVLER